MKTLGQHIADLEQVSRDYETFIESLETYMACPYCGNPHNAESSYKGCCGENHSERAYLYEGEVILESEERALDHAFEDYCSKLPPKWERRQPQED